MYILRVKFTVVTYSKKQQRILLTFSLFIHTVKTDEYKQRHKSHSVQGTQVPFEDESLLEGFVCLSVYLYPFRMFLFLFLPDVLNSYNRYFKIYSIFNLFRRIFHYI